MAVTPNSLITPQTVFTNVVTCTNAKTDLTNTTAAVKIVAAADVPNGGLIKRLYAVPRATNATDMVCHVFRSYNTGTSVQFVDSAVLPASTVSATSVGGKAVFDATADFPWRVKSSEEIFVSIGSALAAGVDFVIEIEAY